MYKHIKDVVPDPDDCFEMIHARNPITGLGAVAGQDAFSDQWVIEFTQSGQQLIYPNWDCAKAALIHWGYTELVYRGGMY